jgi:hypothetical protein
MSQITLDLPEDITAEIESQHISQEEVYRVVLRAIREWLGQRADVSPRGSDDVSVQSSRFAESAIPFAERLIGENRTLFERLAKLPYDDK